jgi:hypothetical protein
VSPWPWRSAAKQSDYLLFICNFLYFNHQVHRGFLITLYKIHVTIYFLQCAYADKRRLTMGIHSKKCVCRRLGLCANVCLHKSGQYSTVHYTPTLYGIAHYTPTLYGIAYYTPRPQTCTVLNTADQACQTCGPHNNTNVTHMALGELSV